ncbi:MAG: signal recognition particle subunit SRP19/SEC65 family protein [Candidatus Thermoplasmatota archaeon]|nr:signal recognition particle subunit SRP19/SEC65 family protein [Candidatus Thermoplasmatota archaeon]
MGVIIYPEYFDAQLTKGKCRRVSKAAAIQNPTVENIARVARSLGYKASIEEKHHPAFWYRKRGRVVIEKRGNEKENKNGIIKKIAEASRK